jgi:hypothetical protein
MDRCPFPDLGFGIAQQAGQDTGGSLGMSVTAAVSTLGMKDANSKATNKMPTKSTSVYLDEHVEMLLDGLRKVGLV